MATITDGLAKITLFSTIIGEEAQNVFYYWDSTNSAITDMNGIATQFDSNLMASLAAATSTQLVFDLIRVTDVKGTNPDHDLAPTQADGDLTGDALPSFNAVRCDLLTQTKETRRGYKRFPGVAESSVVNNKLTVADQILWNAVASTLNNALVVGADTYFAIVFGDKTPTAPTRSISNLILSAIARPDISSQVSRKV